MNQAGPNPSHFVRGNRRPDTASTNGDTPLDLPSSHRPRQRDDKIRVIIVHPRLSVPEIDYFLICFTQDFDKIFLEFITAVVGGEADGGWFRRSGGGEFHGVCLHKSI